VVLCNLGQVSGSILGEFVILSKGSGVDLGLALASLGAGAFTILFAAVGTFDVGVVVVALGGTFSAEVSFVDFGVGVGLVALVFALV
jgi:hypothetical protein